MKKITNQFFDKNKIKLSIVILLFLFIIAVVSPSSLSAATNVLFSHTSPSGPIYSLTVADFLGNGSGQTAFVSGSQPNLLFVVDDKGEVVYKSDSLKSERFVDLAKVDVSGDGFYDLGVVTDESISVFDIRSGDPNPLYSVYLPFGFSYISGIELGDLDGNFSKELIVAVYSSNLGKSRIFAYRSETGVLYYKSADFDGAVVSLCTSDLDGDGKDDIVFGMLDGRVYMIKGESDSMSQQESWVYYYPNGKRSNVLTVIPDVNFDGWKEVVVGTRGLIEGAAEEIYLLSGKEGYLISTYSPEAMGEVLTLTGIDLNGDGTVELIAGTGKQRDYLGRLIPFNRTLVLSVSAKDITLLAETPESSDDNFALCGDFDGDYSLEIAVLSGSDLNLYSYDGVTLVSEASATNIFSGSLLSIRALEASRINPDMVLDIVRGSSDGEVKAISLFTETTPTPSYLLFSNQKATKTKVQPGEGLIVFDTYKLFPEREATLTSLKVEKMGTMNDSYLRTLSLVKDDGSGILDSSDTTIAEAAISNGVAIFNTSTYLQPETTTTLFLAGSLSANAPIGKNFTFAINTTDSLVSYPLIAYGNFPVYSANFMSVDETSPVTVLEKSLPEPDGHNGWYKSSLVINASSTKLGIIYYWFDNDKPRALSGVIVPPTGEHTLYYYSKDIYGNIESTRSLTIKKDLTAPEVPTGVVAEARDANSVDIAWRPSLDKQPGSGLASYKIFRDSLQVGMVPAGVTTFLDVGVTADREFRYQVVAIDEAGNESTYSAVAVAKTPRKPISLPIVNVIAGIDKNVISWTSVSSTEVSSIDIERSAPGSGSSGWHRINMSSLPANSVFYEDYLTQSDIGKTYYYRILLKDASGNILASTPPVKHQKTLGSKIISSTGGVIKPTTEEFILEVPSGATTRNVEISVETTQLAAPVGTVAISDLYQFKPSGLEFSEQPTLTLSFRAPLSADTSLITIGVYSSGHWSYLPTQVDATQGVAVAKISHFSVFGVFFLGSTLDTTPPIISYARSASPHKLFVTFNEFIEATSALTLSNYMVSDATPTSVSLFPDGKSVIIQTNYLEPLTEHTVTVRGVRDLAGNEIVDDGIGNLKTFKVATPPHGKYLDDTNKCSLCHKVHLAKSKDLLIKSRATEVCYLCHDEVGTGSKYNTRAQFESTGSARIHYSRYGDSTVYCTDCHSPHKDPVEKPRLLRVAGETTFTVAERYCFSCHDTSTELPVHLKLSETSYTTSAHFLNMPGPSSGTRLTCINCHTSHSSSIGSLLRGSTEEFTCIACHRENGISPESGVSVSAPNVYGAFLEAPDSTVGIPGFSSTRTVWYRHPVGDYSGRHTLMELFDSTVAATIQSSDLTRHAECGDCHNPHSAKPTIYRSAPFAPESLLGAAGVSITYPDPTQTTLPAFTFIPYNVGVVYEYQLCFRCHSSFAKSSYGDDLASVMSPNNGSFHPVMSPGKNETTAMANGLLGGLTTSSQIFCSDCHLTQNPLLPRGAHGSAFPFILGANYLFELKETSGTDNYNRNDFALCYKCHRPDPFEDNTGVERNDTNFRFHGHHLRNLYNNPSGNTTEGGILTPNAGKGNAICRECHYNPHGYSGTRLLMFSPNVTGPNNEIGGAVFFQKTETENGYCLLSCHGRLHSQENSSY